MKKIIFLFLCASLTITAQSINVSAGGNRDNGLIYQQEGIYIFVLCKPQLDYEVIGTVKNSNIIITKNRYEMLNMLLICCKEEYPDAEAIIISDIKMEQAECIRLK